MSQASTVDPTLDAATLLDRADAVAPLLDERAVDAENGATLPREVVAALGEAGLFRLGLPRSLGGWETDPLTFLRVVEKLSYANGSAGWNTFIGNSSTFFAWLDADVAKELVGDDPDRTSTSVFAPSGQGVPDGRGYRLSGRWTMNSGCTYATWFCNGFIVMDGAAPRMIGDRPDSRWAIYPAEGGRIIETWHDPAGLRGTGSHDVVVDDLPVARELTIAPFHEPPVAEGPLYRLPFSTLVHTMMIGFPLGVGRRALDEFSTIARSHTRGGGGRALADDEDVQTRVGLAEAGLRSARAYVIDAVGAAWEQALRGDDVDTVTRANVLLASQQAMRSAVEAADTAFGLLGVSSLRSGHAVARCWRDLHAAAHHIEYSRDQLRVGARALLGVEQDETTL